MFGLLTGNSLWHLIRQADAMTICVLLILLGMSVVCWAVFFCKLFLLRLKKKQLRDAIAQLSEVHTIDEMLMVASKLAGTVPGYFLSKNLMFFKSILESRNEDNSLRDYEWDLIQQHVDQTLDTMVAHEESYLSILSTSANVSPLLGLFGTVWGLVHSFMSISEKQSADIATVAPGIAEALMTTLAGLMVAIPALVMFNYLSMQVRVVERQLVVLADKLSLVMQRVIG